MLAFGWEVNFRFHFVIGHREGSDYLKFKCIVDCVGVTFDLFAMFVLFTCLFRRLEVGNVQELCQSKR